jgi:hypothetical protein
METKEFDGKTYDSELDKDRLLSQYQRVFDFMKLGEWHTLQEIVDHTGANSASASARLRDMRKIKKGGNIVQRRRKGNSSTGLWEYKLKINSHIKQVDIANSKEMESMFDYAEHVKESVFATLGIPKELQGKYNDFSKYIPINSGLPLNNEPVIAKTDSGFELDAMYKNGNFIFPTDQMIPADSKVISWKRIPGSIRTLNWKEPFASLMLEGKIETRTWNTSYRGLVVICTSKEGYSKNELKYLSGIRQSKRIIQMKKDQEKHIPPGHAVAIGNLIECRPMTKEDEHLCFVKYKPGLFCHIYEDVRHIKQFSWPGYQGWKILSLQQTNLITELK